MDSNVRFYWIQCGNCTRVITGPTFEEALGDFVMEHIGIHTNLHRPTSGLVLR